MAEWIVSFDDNEEKGIVETAKWVKELIRCKDCKMNNQCSIQFKFADADDPENWFCADGER